MNHFEEIRGEIDRRMELLGGTPPGELEAIREAIEAHPNASVSEIADLVIPQYGLQEGVWCGCPQGKEQMRKKL